MHLWIKTYYKQYKFINYTVYFQGTFKIRKHNIDGTRSPISSKKFNMDMI